MGGPSPRTHSLAPRPPPPSTPRARNRKRELPRPSHGGVVGPRRRELRAFAKKNHSSTNRGHLGVGEVGFGRDGAGANLAARKRQVSRWFDNPCPIKRPVATLPIQAAGAATLPTRAARRGNTAHSSRRPGNTAHSSRGARSFGPPPSRARPGRSPMCLPGRSPPGGGEPEYRSATGALRDQRLELALSAHRDGTLLDSALVAAGPPSSSLIGQWFHPAAAPSLDRGGYRPWRGARRST
jgi:hypothetical protein